MSAFLAGGTSDLSDNGSAGTGYLILGANGQLGKALQAKYPKAHAVDSDKLDITDQQALKNFDWSATKTIINAAGYTNVDGAETADGRALAWLVNAAGASNLARIAIDKNLPLIHISTDYVFDGSQKSHSENEPLSPLSTYGASKAAGDIAISLVPTHFIIRTSWLIGEGNNFVRTMMGLAEKDVAPTVVADQIGRLTFTNTLVDAISHLLTTNCQYGTYNVSNDGEPASWADITRAIFKELGREDLNVTNTTTAQYYADKPSSAPRPLQSTLDLSKIKVTGFAPTDWRTDLVKYVQKEMAK